MQYNDGSHYMALASQHFSHSGKYLNLQRVVMAAGLRAFPPEWPCKSKVDTSSSLWGNLKHIPLTQSVGVIYFSVSIRQHWILF